MTNDSRTEAIGVCASPHVDVHKNRIQECESEEEKKEEIEQGSCADAADQVQALLNAIEIIVKLASLDTATYQVSLRQKTHGGDNSHGARHNVCHLQTSLDQIQKEWKLEETAIPRLASSIHQLHSTIHGLHADYDQHAEEFEQLQRKFKACQVRNDKLERAVAKLSQKNDHLQEKIKLQSKEMSSLMNQVESYMHQIKESKKEQKVLEEQTIAYQLHVHQQRLQQSRSQRGRCLSYDALPPLQPTTKGGGRSRTRSHDANFSDLDALNYPHEEDKSTRDQMDESFLNYGSGYDDFADNQSCHSTSSVSTLVTDDGVATVRLELPAGENPSSSRESPLKRAKNIFSDDNSFWGSPPWATSKSKELVQFKLSFSNKHDIGLQFEKVPAHVEAEKSNPLHLSKQRKGVLTDAFIAFDSESIPASIKHSSELGVDQHKLLSSSNFTVNWNVFGKSKAQPEETHNEKNIEKTLKSSAGSFVVCGFVGFDEKSNVRPALGARLTAINGEPVAESWTRTELQDHLVTAKRAPEPSDTCRDGSDTSNSITLTFSVEPLSKNQKAVKDICLPELAETNTRFEATQDGESSSALDAVVKPLSGKFNFLRMGPQLSPVREGRSAVSDNFDHKSTGQEEDSNKRAAPTSVIPRMASFFPGTSKYASSKTQEPIQVGQVEPLAVPKFKKIEQESLELMVQRECETTEAQDDSPSVESVSTSQTTEDESSEVRHCGDVDSDDSGTLDDKKNAYNINWKGLKECNQQSQVAVDPLCGAKEAGQESEQASITGTTAGEKIRSSMMNMGKMFSNPFV